MKLHDTQALINTVKGFAKVRKLGRPAIISHDRTVRLEWASGESRVLHVAQDCDDKDFDRLVKRLRRW